MKVAYECFADGSLVRFLREHCKISLDERHSYSQGNVVNDVLMKKHAAVGLVDEDPRSSHHRGRDRFVLEQPGTDVDVLVCTDQHLLLLKPDIEGCFIRAQRRLGLVSKLASEPAALHRVLGTSHAGRHARFREELVELHEASKARSIVVFTVELETALRTIEKSG